MHVSTEDFDRLEKESLRAKAKRELDIKQLIGVVEGFLLLLDGEATSDITWAMESLSDESIDAIAARLAEAESFIANMNGKYLFAGE